MLDHPLNLVCVHVGCIHLYGGGKINDQRVLRSGSPGIGHCVTDFQSIVQFRTGKALRGILQLDSAGKLCCTFLHHLRTLDCNLSDMLPVHMEDHISLKGGCRIVNMHNCLLTTLNCLEGSVNQFFSALGQYLHHYIIGDQPSVHQLTQEIKFNLTGRGETDLDFLKAQLHQKLEHFNLFFYDHGINQRLIAIPKVYAAPDRCLSNFFVRPFPFRVINDRVFTISTVV